MHEDVARLRSELAEALPAMVGYSNEAKAVGVGILMLLVDKGLIDPSDREMVFDWVREMTNGKPPEPPETPQTPTYSGNVVSLQEMARRFRPKGGGRA